MRKWFLNLKFFYKLLISMITITTLALLFIVGISYAYFYHKNMNDIKEKVETSVAMAGSTFSDQFNTLSTSTNLLLVKAPFPQMILDINQNNFSGYAKYFSDALSETDSFIQNHDFVNNVILCGEDNIVFSPSALGITDTVQQLFPENIWNYPRITVFPSRSDSLFKQGETIPISFPVSCRTNSRVLSYQDAEETNRVRFILLLDTGQIRSYFNRMSNSYTSCMYLADTAGNPLDIKEEHYPEAFLPEFQKVISQAEDIKNRAVMADKDQYYLSVSSIGFCGLKVVHLMKNSSFLGDIHELQSFFIGVWLLCLLCSGFLSFILSRFLTGGIQKLSHVIAEINENTYNCSTAFSSADEIGLLGRQLNTMYGTIQKQLIQIQKEEQKKARAEIQMMSEQINPHFLYNTLECIHFQILNGHTSSAGGMLESLGRYLRITLSVGESFIPIKKEVEHVTLYMDIMNRHSANGIYFKCQVDSALMEHMIMKVLLQPLVENCIKHGFQDIENSLVAVSPQITVSIYSVDNSFIIIEVSDNGKGINLETANACLESATVAGQRHFGLNNLSRRLKIYYGERAFISISSIPYLKNSITIKIPMMNH